MNPDSPRNPNVDDNLQVINQNEEAGDNGVEAVLNIDEPPSAEMTYIMEQNVALRKICRALTSRLIAMVANSETNSNSEENFQPPESAMTSGGAVHQEICSNDFNKLVETSEERESNSSKNNCMDVDTATEEEVVVFTTQPSGAENVKWSDSTFDDLSNRQD